MVDKKVKIIATTGPAVDSAEAILELAKEGVDIFRINLSHANEDEMKSRVEWVREAEKKLGRPLTVMGDLAGPKIRIGDVEENTVLKRGEKLIIHRDQIMGNEEGFSLNHASLIDILKPGAEVYIDDGYIKLRVIKDVSEGVQAEVVVGGVLKPRKGFSAEGLSLASAGLSEKDRVDIKRMLALDTDALAVSFVQSEKDIEAVRKVLPKDSRIYLIAKIETAMGVENAEKILEVADGLMVARGDMGLAVPIAEVPHIQKRLINLCLQKAKPVITATQMLESMINAPIPTRAEVTDVANAILDGTDAVMLSAETASGKFPAETVRMMVKIIKEAEEYVTPRIYGEDDSVSHAVTAGIGEIADQIHAKLIVAFTEKGVTARRISRHRHPQTILALSPDPKSVRNLNFSWGVHPIKIKTTTGFMNMREQATEVAENNELVKLKKGEPFVIAAGMPFGQTGSTNMIFVERV